MSQKHNVVQSSWPSRLNGAWVTPPAEPVSVRTEINSVESLVTWGAVSD